MLFFLSVGEVGHFVAIPRSNKFISPVSKNNRHTDFALSSSMSLHSRAVDDIADHPLYHAPQQHTANFNRLRFHKHAHGHREAHIPVGWYCNTNDESNRKPLCQMRRMKAQKYPPDLAIHIFPLAQYSHYSWSHRFQLVTVCSYKTLHGHYKFIHINICQSKGSKACNHREPSKYYNPAYGDKTVPATQSGFVSWIEWNTKVCKYHVGSFQGSKSRWITLFD